MIAGSFSGFALQNGQIALLISPFITFVAFYWAHNEIRIRQMGKYLEVEYENKYEKANSDKAEIEIPQKKFGWETFRVNNYKDT